MDTVYKTKNHQVKKSPDAGFSLLEMITVVLMIGILSAIIAPNWLAFANRQRLNKANDAILSAIKQTQTEARSRKINYSVSFRVDSISNIPEYIIYQGTTAPSTGWLSLKDTIGLKSRQVFLYSNLSSLTAYNTKSGNSVVTTTTGTGTITFDYLGALANKSSNTSADAPLGIMVSIPQTTGSAATDLKRCVIIQGLVAGTRTAKDTECVNLSQ